MPNIASVLKSEIARVARKEVRAETEGLKKAVTAYRTEIAALKRRAQGLEQAVKRLAKSAPQPAAAVDSAESGQSLRFSAKGFASTRQRLGLSADECGRLLGTSAQTVYNWEKGGPRPRAKYLPGIVALRSMGKKEVAARLAAMSEAA